MISRGGLAHGMAKSRRAKKRRANQNHVNKWDVPLTSRYTYRPTLRIHARMHARAHARAAFFTSASTPARLRPLPPIRHITQHRPTGWLDSLYVRYSPLPPPSPPPCQITKLTGVPRSQALRSVRRYRHSRGQGAPRGRPQCFRACDCEATACARGTVAASVTTNRAITVAAAAILLTHYSPPLTFAHIRSHSLAFARLCRSTSKRNSVPRWPPSRFGAWIRTRQCVIGVFARGKKTGSISPFSVSDSSRGLRHLPSRLPSCIPRASPPPPPSPRLARPTFNHWTHSAHSSQHPNAPSPLSPHRHITTAPIYPQASSSSTPSSLRRLTPPSWTQGTMHRCFSMPSSYLTSFSPSR